MGLLQGIGEAILGILLLLIAFAALGYLFWIWMFWHRSLRLGGWPEGVSLIVSGVATFCLWPFWTIYMLFRLWQGRPIRR